jgi:tRNA(Ile)-lysidine synthase
VSHHQPLLIKVQRWLSDQQLPPGGLVVAVSGGPDSVALLRALQTLWGSQPDQPICIAHLNHQLRGPDSDADEAFVHELHAQFTRDYPSLLWRCERIDVATRARQEKANIEALARRLRYGWLTQIAQEIGARWIATGHSADDLAETVLHRLLRGSGLQGLCGIAPRRMLTEDVGLIRPLLDVTRAEVCAYLEALNQPYCLDRSNSDRAFTRNRLRYELLPLLAREYNPAVSEALCRLARQAREAHRQGQARGQALLTAAELPRAGRVVILDTQRLAVAPRELVREVLRLVWQREGWPTGAMDFDSWDRAAAVAQGEKVCSDLPGRIRIRCRKSVIQVARSEHFSIAGRPAE